MTASPGRGDLAGIEALRRQAGEGTVGTAAVVCLCERRVPLTRDAFAIPVWAVQ
ncbi:MAG: hypothetical protein AB1505_34390 [Candidatus Latescibacterota bacterium]